MAANKGQAPDSPEAEPAATLGAKLRSARESQELSIEAVEAELRIGAEYLEALEHDRFDELGAPVFARGYLKQYGARLGLDVAELLAEFDSSDGNRNVEIRPLSEFQHRARPSNAPWFIAGFVLSATVAAIIWWFALGPGSSQVQ